MLLYLVAVLFGCLYWYVRRLFTYWERRGIPTVPAIIPYGNFSTIGTRHNHQELMKDIYDQLRHTGEPFCGVYSLFRPIALLLDPQLIKSVLVTDFDAFHDRGVFHNERDDPLSANLLTIEGQLWRDMRQKMTSIFTATKLRSMLPTVYGVADVMVATVEAEAAGAAGRTVEVKDLLSGFMTDVIGVCAFGLELNNLQEPDPVFRNFGKKTFDKPRNHPIHSLMLSLFPNVGRALGCLMINEDVTEFYLGMVRRTISYREQHNVQRKDFLNLMMELRSQSADQNDGQLKLSVEQIAAESFAFFLAGLGTTTSMMSFLLYEMALNEEVQNRMREEVYEVLGRTGGEITYDALGEMTYMMQALNESLRKYPPFGNTIRIARRDYLVPGTKHIIEEGTSVWTPVMGIHHNPDYYPDPDRFDPERFSAAATAARDPMLFLPFGGGPRKCMGYRFVMMVARLALVKLLTHYRFERCAATNVPLHISKKFVLHEPVDGVRLAVHALDGDRRRY